MKFATCLVRVNAVLFMMFGICFIAAPEFFAQAITGAIPATVSATTDMRATYGGMGLGIGMMFWFCARQRETLIAGVAGTIMVLGAIAFGRLVGFVVDGAPNAFMLALVGAEILFTVLSILALKRITD